MYINRLLDDMEAPIRARLAEAGETFPNYPAGTFSLMEAVGNELVAAAEGRDTVRTDLLADAWAEMATGFVEAVRAWSRR